MAVTPAGAPAAEAQRSADRPRLMLIVNPTATTVTTRRGEQIERVLAGAYDVDTRLTDHAGHATELAAEAVDYGAAVVAVYAGDGTTNEAIRSLAGTQTALAHLPGGNASVLARMLGMGADGVKAAEHVASLVDAPPQSIDLGYVNGRPFSFTAGIGLDAAVVKLVDADQARKHRFRWGAFWMEAVRLARSEYFVKEPMLTVESGGESRAGITAIVQNGEYYSYVGPRHLTVGDGATLTSGTLAASVLLPGLGFRDVPTITARTVGPIQASRHAHIAPLPASTDVRVTTKRPMPIQLDGDYWCDVTEAHFTVHPGALRVIR